MKTSKTSETQLENAAQNVLDDARELLSATANVAEEKVVEARRRLTAALERAKDCGSEMWENVSEKTVAGARAADKTIREHPYQSIGVAFGVGALLGFLLTRRSS